MQEKRRHNTICIQIIWCGVALWSHFWSNPNSIRGGNGAGRDSRLWAITEVTTHVIRCRDDLKYECFIFFSIDVSNTHLLAVITKLSAKQVSMISHAVLVITRGPLILVTYSEELWVHHWVTVWVVLGCYHWNNGRACLISSQYLDDNIHDLTHWTLVKMDEFCWRQLSNENARISNKISFEYFLGFKITMSQQ